jgi:hypothetical protein
MSAKNPVGDKATAVVADDWKETLKRVGGSQAVEGRGDQQTDLVLPKEGNCTGPGAAIYPLAPAPAG